MVQQDSPQLLGGPSGWLFKGSTSDRSIWHTELLGSSMQWMQKELILMAHVFKTLERNGGIAVLMFI